MERMAACMIESFALLGGPGPQRGSITAQEPADFGHQCQDKSRYVQILRKLKKKP